LGFQIHGLPLLGYPISSQILSISLTLLWILLITNSFNLIDGLDGLSGGLAFIAGLTLLAISLVRGDVQTALLATVLCGAIGGFLRYNFHPASIFMGDSGSLFLGYVLSLVALRSSTKGVATVAILAPLLVLALPLFDTLLAVARRLLRAVHLVEVANGRYRFLFAGGRGLFEADRDHVHHRLLDLGLSHRRAVLCLYGIGLALGVLAILSVIRSGFQYGLFLLVIVLASVAGLRKLGYRELEVMRRGLALGIFELPVLGHPFFHPFFDLAVAAAAYYGAFVLKGDRFDLGPFKELFLGTLFALLAAKLLPF
jgi:UDP-GlcNAc:undecaprenyl-phosphate GlcNAc-1-phosphate transferase